MKTNKAFILFPDGFEECEGSTVLSIFRNAGIDIESVSISTNKEVLGAQNIRILTDTIWDDEKIADGDVLILIGGESGVQKMLQHKPLITMLQSFNSSKKIIAALYTSSTVLYKAGILNGKNVCHIKQYCDSFDQAFVIHKNVVVDGNIVTGASGGAAIEFSLELVKLLMGQEEYNSQYLRLFP